LAVVKDEAIREAEKAVLFRNTLLDQGMQEGYGPGLAAGSETELDFSTEALQE
jgi:hypothetical protein